MRNTRPASQNPRVGGAASPEVGQGQTESQLQASKYSPLICHRALAMASSVQGFVSHITGPTPRSVSARAGRTATATPKTTSATPVARASQAPPGNTFSAATVAATSRSAQQQPRQYTACDQPRARPPRHPARQWPSRNPRGLWQCRRQTSLRGDIWNRPETTRTTATP